MIIENLDLVRMTAVRSAIGAAVGFVAGFVAYEACIKKWGVQRGTAVFFSTLAAIAVITIGTLS
jgi:hypothetical protein